MVSSALLAEKEQQTKSAQHSLGLGLVAFVGRRFKKLGYFKMCVVDVDQSRDAQSLCIHYTSKLAELDDLD